MKKVIMIMTLIIAVLSTISSLIGIFYSYESDVESMVSVHNQTVELYQKGIYYLDSMSVAAQGIASDVITLLIAVPVLLVSLYFYSKDSFRGKILLTGMIGYFLYTYMSYVFLWNYNFMFLVYVALMSISLYEFIFLMMSFDYKTAKQQFHDTIPRRLLGGYQIAISIFIGFMWLGIIVGSLLNGETPEILEHYTTLVIQAMDLGFVIPLAVLSGILLIKDNSYGYIISSVVIVKATMMLAAITTMVMNQLLNHVDVGVSMLVIFGLFTVLSSVMLYILLKSVKTDLAVS